MVSSEEVEAAHVAGTCRRCGKCCVELGTPPYMPDELVAIPETIADIVRGMWAGDPDRSESGLPCYFFDQVSGDCLVYPYRPGICRAFEPDDEGCNNWREGKAP